MHVTVAICTWNRADLLDQTLEQMRHLLIPERVTWELLVVNNNCSDHTDEVIAKHTDALPLRRLFELTQGHTWARNRAIEEAAGELLIWTDDDVLVDPEWLGAYVRAARQYPWCGFFAGRVDPWFETEPPEWLAKRLPDLSGVYALIDLGDNLIPFPPDRFPAGANMAIRSDLQKSHPFNTKLGRCKSSMMGGDDNQLYRDLCKCGVQSLWVSDARVRHFIPQSRLTRRYIGDWYEGAARTAVRDGSTALDVGARTWFGVPRWIFRQWTGSLAKSVFFRVFDMERYIDEHIKSRKLKGTIQEFIHFRRALGRSTAQHSS